MIPGDGDPSLSDLQSLPYLTSCIREALRINPPGVHLTPRTTSKPLYLGKFQVKEIQFPHGMVDTGENITNVELVYAGQEVEVTETSASFYNQRQKALVTLDKVLEQDETFGIGMNGEISAVTFGLYAQESTEAVESLKMVRDLSTHVLQ